jgi:hypothetical protein
LTTQHTTCQSSCHIVSNNYVHFVHNCELSTYFRVDHMLNFLNHLEDTDTPSIFKLKHKVVSLVRMLTTWSIGPGWNRRTKCSSYDHLRRGCVYFQFSRRGRRMNHILYFKRKHACSSLIHCFIESTCADGGSPLYPSVSVIRPRIGPQWTRFF